MMNQYLSTTLVCIVLVACNQPAKCSDNAEKVKDTITIENLARNTTAESVVKISESTDTTTYSSKDLIGHWVSMKDKNYTMIVTDANFEEFYEKEKTNIYSYLIQKDKLIKIDHEDQDTLRYDILSVSKNNITFLSDNGNILPFKRTK
jgi:hypothetical protein